MHRTLGELHHCLSGEIALSLYLYPSFPLFLYLLNLQSPLSTSLCPFPSIALSLSLYLSLSSTASIMFSLLLHSHFLSQFSHSLHLIFHPPLSHIIASLALSPPLRSPSLRGLTEPRLPPTPPHDARRAGQDQASWPPIKQASQSTRGEKIKERWLAEPTGQSPDPGGSPDPERSGAERAKNCGG